MVILILLALLFGAFFLIRHHTGPAHLAVIAGVSVYETFGGQILDLIHKTNIGLPDPKLRALIFAVLVLGFPMILYFRSSRGGMFGLLRIAEAALLAALVTSLLAPHVAEWFAFDSLSNQILEWINSFKGPIMMVGVVTAYLDILLYRE